MPHHSNLEILRGIPVMILGKLRPLSSQGKEIRMGLCNKKVRAAREFIALVNKCFDILNIPRLSGVQSIMIIIAMIVTATDIGPLRQTFIQKLEDVFKMKPGVEQEQALRRLLGMMQMR